MTALPAEITIAGLRGRVAELLDARDKDAQDLTDARDQIQQLTAERDSLKGLLCGSQTELRDGVVAWGKAERERDEARAAIDRVREYVGAELALTNVEMADLKHLPHDAHHEDCGAVWQGYFLRMVRAAIDGGGT